MGIDPNNVSIDWSTINSDSNVNVAPQSTSTGASNPLITTCIENGNNLLISHEIFTENHSDKKSN